MCSDAAHACRGRGGGGGGGGGEQNLHHPKTLLSSMKGIWRNSVPSFRNSSSFHSYHFFCPLSMVRRLGISNSGVQLIV